MSRRSRGRGVEKSGGGGAPGWMVTYGDLMSLLLVFFVLLYSMSNLDAEKFESMSQSLQAALAGLGYPSVLEGQKKDKPLDLDRENSLDIIDSKDNNKNNIVVREEIVNMYRKVQSYVEEQELDAEVSVSMNRRGVFVDIKEPILFEPGSATLKGTGEEILKRLEGLINDFDNGIVIEGHTDDVPMNTQLYPSNWELSTGRAVAVVRRLSEAEGVDPTRLSAVGYGEYSPIVANDSVENRALNRRVNILIIFDEESDVIDG